MIHNFEQIERYALAIYPTILNRKFIEDDAEGSSDPTVFLKAALVACIAAEALAETLKKHYPLKTG